VDSNHQPLELATVSVFNSINDELEGAVATNVNGQFTLLLPNKGKYYLLASYLGEQSEKHRFNLKGNTHLDTIIINTQNKLDEVVVTAQKPKLERKADRYVFTIQNTSLVQGNLMDALSRTPGLIKINGGLSFKGETDIGIMINDKLINLPAQNVLDMLNNASANTVKSIEVITNPPSKYSAEGNVLINITMEGSMVAGYHGSINTSFAQGNFPKYGIGTDHFFKTKKMGLTMSYGYNDRKLANGYVDNTNFLNGQGVGNWNAEQKRVRNSVAHNANVFFDLKPNKQMSFAITSVNQITPSNNQDIDTHTKITGTFDEDFNSFFSKNVLLRKELSSSSYLDFNYDFARLKGSLSASFHFTYFEKQREQDVTNDFFTSTGDLNNEIDFTTVSDQQIRITGGQLNYDSKAGEHGKFETGIKFAGIDSNSFLEQNGTEALNIDDLATDGSFEYDEQIYAAYANMKFSWDKTELAYGIRTEYTQTQGTLLRTNETFRNNYLEWFPNVSIKHDLQKERSLLLYYYRRISRPRYDQINPFRLFQGYNSTVEGNPRLQPATRHYLAGGYGFNKWFSIELFYRHRTNQLRTLTFQDNTQNIVRFINTNVDREQGVGVDLILNKTVAPFWQTYVLGSYYYLDNRFQDLESGIFGNTSGWTLALTCNNSFSLLPKRDLTLDLDIRYRSALVYGNAKDGSYGSVNLSFRKTLFKGNGSIGAGITDIFRQRAYLQTRRFLDQDNTSFVDPETPIVNFNFRYRFGNTSIKTNKRGKRGQEVDRI